MFRTQTLPESDSGNANFERLCITPLAQVQLPLPVRLEQLVPEPFLRMAVVLEHLQPSCHQPMGSVQPLEQPEHARVRHYRLQELVCSNCYHQMMAD